MTHIYIYSGKGLVSNESNIDKLDFNIALVIIKSSSAFPQRCLHIIPQTEKYLSIKADDAKQLERILYKSNNLGNSLELFFQKIVELCGKDDFLSTMDVMICLN